MINYPISISVGVQYVVISNVGHQAAHMLLMKRNDLHIGVVMLLYGAVQDSVWDSDAGFIVIVLASQIWESRAVMNNSRHSEVDGV